MRNVNDDVKKQTNFVNMLICKNDTVILILLQCVVKLTNCKAVRALP